MEETIYNGRMEKDRTCGPGAPSGQSAYDMRISAALLSEGWAA